ncbi:MAG: TonB-dependent receptor [Opitutus sp.]|nr:TonB-dependent receptor [Opitutus sp.]
MSPPLTAPNPLRRRRSEIILIGLVGFGSAQHLSHAQATNNAATSGASTSAVATPRPEEVNAIAKEGITALGKFFVSDAKLEPFSGSNVDLPRTIDDVQPYYFYDAKEITMSGATNIEDFLRQNMSMDASAASESQNVALSGNQSSVNLRGLGDTQTLILINGRRAPAGNLALNGGGSQANINSIPMSAVDRIEVLPSSAGAIYGGNAVGGVINIILKRDYSGGQIRGTYQNPESSDAPIRRIDASYGFALEGGRTRVTLTSSYADQKLLQHQDLFFLNRYEKLIFKNTGLINIGVLPVGATPNIRNGTATTNLVLKNGGGSIGSPVTFIPYGIGPTTPAAVLAAGLRTNAGLINKDRGTYSRQFLGGSMQELGQGQRSKSFGLTVRREMNPNLELNADFTITNAGHTRNGNFYQTQSVAAAAPSNPFTTAVNVYAPLPGEWPHWSSNVTRQLTLGFVQKLPRGWRAQGDYSWNSTNNSFYSRQAGTTLATADITAALNAGRLNPFVDTTLYQFNLSPYQGLYSYTGAGGSNSLALRLAGPAWRLPAGAPRIGIGLERLIQGQRDSDRYVTFENFPARNTQIAGLGKRQTTHSLYVEAQVPVIAEAQKIPLVRKLSLQVAARTEDYVVRTGTGSITILPVPARPPVVRSNRAHYLTTKPTAGLSYKPLGWLQLRGSISRGFTPPRYTQLVFDPTPSTAPVNIIDPRRGGARTSVFTIGGGNPDLDPETSQSMNTGIIIEPDSGLLRGLRLSADYNFTRTQQNIGSLSTQQLVDLEAMYPGRVDRADPVPGDPFGVGFIETVHISPLNLLKAFVETFDVNVAYRKRTDGFGALIGSARGTFGNHYKRKTSLNQPMIEYGNVSGLGPLKFTGNTSLAWDYERYTVRWSTRYYCKYRVAGPPIVALSVNVIPQGGEFVPSQMYSDLVVGYRIPARGRSATPSWADRALPGVEIQLGIDNILKKIPPYDWYSLYNYSSRGNPRLRDYRLSVTKPF